MDLEIRHLFSIKSHGWERSHLNGYFSSWWWGKWLLVPWHEDSRHDQVPTYEDLTRMMVNRFVQKYLEISFRELVHVKKTRTPKAYFSKFQNLVLRVTDIFESRLILLFIEGLTEPLKELVKAYRPSTLQDAMSRTRYLQDVIPRTRFPPRTCVPA